MLVETMRMASLSENNLWSAFSETGQLSMTSTADLHSPSSTLCNVLNVMHVRMASLSEACMHMWHEGVAGRGSCEIRSCILWQKCLKMAE